MSKLSFDEHPAEHIEYHSGKQVACHSHHRAAPYFDNFHSTQPLARGQPHDLERLTRAAALPVPENQPGEFQHARRLVTSAGSAFTEMALAQPGVISP